MVWKWQCILNNLKPSFSCITLHHLNLAIRAGTHAGTQEIAKRKGTVGTIVITVMSLIALFLW